MKKKSSRGFTLIELLVVITIIGILASLAIPTIAAALKAAKKAEAKVFMSGLQNALVNYQTEYNTFPAFITALPTPGNAILKDQGAWSDYYTAIAVPTGQIAGKAAFLAANNPRQISFLTVQPKYLDTPAAPATATYFKDPWGQLYTMWVDTDYDNMLNQVTNINTGAGTLDVPGTVLVWCGADDNIPGTAATIKKSIGTWK